MKTFSRSSIHRSTPHVSVRSNFVSKYHTTPNRTSAYIRPAFFSATAPKQHNLFTRHSVVSFNATSFFKQIHTQSITSTTKATARPVSTPSQKEEYTEEEEISEYEKTVQQIESELHKVRSLDPPPPKTVLPYKLVPTKHQMRVKAYQREHSWHLRQEKNRPEPKLKEHLKEFPLNAGPKQLFPETLKDMVLEKIKQEGYPLEKVGINKLMRSIPIQKDILDYIKKNDLGRFRIYKKYRVTRRKRGTLPLPPKTPVDLVFEKFAFRFKFAAAKESSFPPPKYPEIVLVGRTNVGKSSLINAMVNAPKSRTDERPGTTKTINWFIGPKVAIVDCPGYGFAYAKEDDIVERNNLLQLYLERRPNIEKVLLVVDARHGLKSSDLQMARNLDAVKLPFQVVMTKADLVLQEKLAQMCYYVQNQIAKFRFANKKVLMASSYNRSGIHLIKEELGTIGGLKTRIEKMTKFQEEERIKKMAPPDEDYGGVTQIPDQAGRTIAPPKAKGLPQGQKHKSLPLHSQKSKELSLVPAQRRRR